MFRSIRLRLPELIFAVLMLAAAWFLSGRLPDSDLPFRLLLSLSLPVIAAAAVLLSRVSRRDLRLLMAALAGILLLLRLIWFPVETTDYTDFLRPWTSWYHAHGGLQALGRNVGNYNVPYLVFLALFSYWDVPVLYLIKLLSAVFDLVLAIALSRIVILLTDSEKRGAAVFLLALALPTVFINGSIWGQCDSIYVSLALLGLHFTLDRKPCAGMICLGFSFAFKLQAIFLIPVFFACMLCGKLKLRHLPLFPAAYALAVSPAVLAGKPASDAFLFYFKTASTVGDGLNYNSPSMYSLKCFWQVSDPENAAMLGVFYALILCTLFALIFLLRRKKIDDRSILFAALLLTCGIPLFLPHMHDRYFFFCDMLTLAVAFVVPWTAPFVLFSQFASLLGYYAYFYRVYLLPMRYGFWVLVPVALCSALLCCIRLWRKDTAAALHEPGKE